MKGTDRALDWKGLAHFLKIFGVFLLIGIAGYGAVFGTDWFVLKGYQVRANEDRKGYFDQNFNRYFKGHNTFAVSIDEGLDDLRKDSAIKSAEIHRALPGEIRYDIQFRQPIACIVQDSDNLFLDEDGFLIRTAPSSDQPYTSITGLSLDHYVAGKMLETSDADNLHTALQLVQLLNQTPFGKKAVVNISAKNMEVRLSDGFKGKFSYTGSLEERFNSFAAIYDNLINKIGRAHV